jgi:amino acid adenylation domain-containing protein
MFSIFKLVQNLKHKKLPKRSVPFGKKVLTFLVKKLYNFTEYKEIQGDIMKKDVYELTNPQKNIWELEQINGDGTPINHIFSILKLTGNLDEDLLVKTMNKIIEMNDSFRLKFVRNGSNLCQYVEDYQYTPIEVKHFDTEDISVAINEYQNLEISLHKLFSFCLVFTPCYTYVLYKSHHLIADAWSISQVAEQVKDFYEKLLNNDTSSAFIKPSYTTFIDREKTYSETNKFQIDEQFWNDYATHLSATKLFPNSNHLQKNAKRYQQPIENTLFRSISDYCEKNKITEYSFFLGIFSIYFCKIYNLPSIVFGTPFLNRQKRLKELESTGMFVSTLPLMIEMDMQDTFLSMCKKISLTNMSLFKHSCFPYHKIQEMYCNGTKENTALYEIGFSYQINKQENSMENNDLGECTWFFSGQQNNPLTIHLTTLNDEKILNYDYLLTCFTEYEVQKMNSIILHLISEVLEGKEAISDINLLTEDDIKMLSSLNSTGVVSNSNQTVVSIFDDIVNRYPDSIAICYDGTYVSYSELNKKINNIAKILLNLGLTKNTPVALFLDKSIEMIAAMFGVLKAGGCYVPILPDESASRIEYILNDCTPKCILTHKDYDTKIPSKSVVINLDQLDLNGFYDIDISNITPEDNAYIIYTSGSTGNPKGTMIMHKNIVGLKTSIENDSVLKATNKDVSISLLKYSFDASGIDIYTSLLFGGKLVLVKKEDELNPEKIIRIMEQENVTRSFLIPTWIEHIALQDKLLNADLSSLRILGTGGETLKPYILENLLSKYSNLKVLNLYGPTETTMFTTCKDVSVYEIKNNYTSIGKPIYGSHLLVVNSNLEVMPIDATGELVIYEDENSIQNIAKGYLNLPETTQSKFVKIISPFSGKLVKAYRTGDIAKVNKQLEIEFIGRDDDVVKVNGGYLVALNEVENRIQKLLGNNFEVYPIAIPHKNTKAIFLFLTKKEKNITLYHIKNYINSNISFYMKPKKIIELEEFPRNSSGKINRKELEKIAFEYIEENKNKYIPPKTEVEIDIYNYVKELIGTDEFSITDDFIEDLGIDSLSLTAIYTYLEKYNILIQDIYNNSNIKDLANFIENNSCHDVKPDVTNIDNIKILNNVEKFDLTTILITGVTGFLGIHLLRDLLLNDKVEKIYCMIRNQINLNGKKRLLKMIDFYFNSDENLLQLIDKKVIIFNGDMTKDNFGLDKKSYLEIKQDVTTVINSAANVKHFAKPDQIYKDNVQSVNNLIAFCDNSISLAHISTLSIAGFRGESTENKIFDENTLFINQDFNNNPYLVTKFEAEKKILDASNNGLNAVIFRLGNIMPRVSDGVFQENASQNVFLSSIKAIFDSKVVAKDLLGLKLEFSPVDECSYIILKLLENGSPNSIYHILNNKEISILELKTLLKFLNCDILDVDLKTFIDEMNKNTDEYTKEYILSNNLNTYSQDITLAKLAELNIEWSSIDLPYMQKILNIIKEM